MCIAIYKPAGVTLSKDLLKNCAEANRDGCGFTYINESYTGVRKLFIKKSLDFETFYAQYERATRVNNDSPFLVHFRIKTHGNTDKANCHPFMIDNDSVFIHNGIISGVGFDADKSDTRLFNEKVLQVLPSGWESNEAIRLMVGEFIGQSKIVTMNVEGDVQIINEEKGHWHNKCWFSNSSYVKRAPIKKGVVGGGTARGNNMPYHRTYTIESYDRCSTCGIYNKITEMHPYRIFSGVYEAYCSKCVDEALRVSYVYTEDKCTHDTFIRYKNDEDMD